MGIRSVVPSFQKILVRNQHEVFQSKFVQYSPLFLPQGYIYENFFLQFGIKLSFSKESYFFPSNYRRSTCKKPRGKTIVCRSLPGIWFHNRRKMDQILWAYGFPKGTVRAIIMFHRNTKVKVHSPGGGTDFFHIVAGVLQGDIFTIFTIIVYYLPWLRISNIDRYNQSKWHYTKNAKKKTSRRNYNGRRLCW